MGAERSAEKCRDDYYTSSPGQAIRVLPDIERHVNDLCERHRWGYRFENGEGRKVSSPALDVEIVGPTLLAVARPGWEQAQRSFKEALDHQRGGETDDALTAAHAALEAALKALGVTGQFSTTSFVTPSPSRPTFARSRRRLMHC
jgi:hypothetical protein